MIPAEERKNIPQGLKPSIHALVTARLKACPCYKAPWIEFFRSL
jgi:hypothetical protein